LTDALDKRLQAAQTKEEVALLERTTRELADSGLLMGRDYSTSLDKIKTKAKELDPVLRELQAAAAASARAATENLQAVVAEAAGIDSTLKTYSTTGRTRGERLAGQNAVDASAQSALLQRARPAR